MRRKGHVSTSRPSKSHVVDRHPFAEPQEGHAPTAHCEIPQRSSCTTGALLSKHPRHPCDSLLHSAQPTMTSQAYHTAILHLFQNLSPPIPSSGADSIPTFAIGERHHITGWQHSAIPSLLLQLVSGVMVAEFRQHSTIPFLRLQLAGWHVCIRKRYAT